MLLTITTPAAKMDFEMTEEKAEALIHQALRYANGTAPGETPANAQQAEAPEPVKKPHSRLERMFGDWKARIPDMEKLDGEEYHKGFLLIQCKHCGRLKGFCAKKLINMYRCECGGQTELRELKPAYLHCECGKDFKYQTNVADEMFDFPCLNCGNPVPLRLNRRSDTYITLTDKEDD